MSRNPGEIERRWTSLLSIVWRIILPIIVAAIVVSVVTAIIVRMLHWIKHGIRRRSPYGQPSSPEPVKAAAMAGLSTAGLGGVGLLFALLAVVTILTVYVFPVPREAKQIPETVRRVWLPSERVQVTNGGQITGYVLSTESGWFTILLESDRTIIRLPASTVEARTICRLEDPDSLPLT
jgi:hypothetical protein